MTSLSAVHSFLACCLVLVIGHALTTRVGVLARYSIPEPIVGGLLFAVFTYAVSQTTGHQITLDTTIKTTLLLVFFGCIGLTADLKLLAQGGPRLMLLLLCLVPFLVLQNAVGLGMAWLLDLHPLMGLVGGSITLIGGHGTGAAYATRFADINNIQDVMALAMTAATMGLVLGGVIGGPVAEWLIKRNKLGHQAVNTGTGSTDNTAPHNALPEATTPVVQSPKNNPVHATAFIRSMTAALVALAVGSVIAGWVAAAPVSLPNFLWCLAIGILIRNAGPAVGLVLNDRATDLIGSLALALFLGFTMMTLDLASVARLAGPLALMLLVQTLVAITYVILVVFRTLKKDYEAAVISAAFCGLAVGATATAIANMQAITSRHGPSPQAFIVIPVTGAFLVDIINVIVLTSLLALPFVGGI